MCPLQKKLLDFPIGFEGSKDKEGQKGGAHFTTELFYCQNPASDLTVTHENLTKITSKTERIPNFNGIFPNNLLLKLPLPGIFLQLMLYIKLLQEFDFLSYVTPAEKKLLPLTKRTFMWHDQTSCRIFWQWNWFPVNRGGNTPDNCQRGKAELLSLSFQFPNLTLSMMRRSYVWWSQSRIGFSKKEEGKRGESLGIFNNREDLLSYWTCQDSLFIIPSDFPSLLSVLYIVGSSVFT